MTHWFEDAINFNMHLKDTRDLLWYIADSNLKHIELINEVFEVELILLKQSCKDSGEVKTKV